LIQIRVYGTRQVNLHLPGGKYEEEKKKSESGLAGIPMHCSSNARKLPGGKFYLKSQISGLKNCSRSGTQEEGLPLARSLRSLERPRTQRDPDTFH
jgi:hypothetical protein